MNLKQYLAVYRNFISCSMTEELTYRVNFFMILIVDVIFTLSTLGAAFVLFEHIEQLGPWNRDQLLLFFCFMLIVDDFQGLVLSSNFWMLSMDLKAGNLDFTFLKPVKSLFPMFFRYLRPSSLISLAVDVGLIVYFGNKVGLSTLQFSLIFPLLVAAIILRFLVEMVIALLMFWTTEGVGINFVRLQLQSLSRWRDFIYKGIARRALTTVLPILVIGSAPMHFLFDFSKWHSLTLLMALIVVFAFVLRFTWTHAKRRYESASS